MRTVPPRMQRPPILRDGPAWLSIATVAGAGGLVTGTSPVPLEWTTMGFVGPVLLLHAVSRAETAQHLGLAFLAGWVFSSVINAMELYWVVGLLEAFGGFPTALAVPTGALLWCAQGVPYGLGAVMAVALVRASPHSRIGLWWVLPCTLTVVTSLAPKLFPWRLAHSQIGWLPYVQLAEIGGEALLDLSVAGAAGAIFEAMRRGSWRERAVPVGVAVLSIFGPPTWGMARMETIEARRHAAPMLRVGVVQPNVGILEKRDPRLVGRHLRDLQLSTRNLESLGADVVIWPESAYPYGVPRTQRHDHQGALSARGDHVQGPLLFGALTIGRPTEAGSRGPRYNSVVAMASDGTIAGISDKVELLAFGEYTPLWDYLPPLQDRFPRGLTPGDVPRVLALNDVRFGVLNCYEDVLPRHGRWVARHDPDLLVNVTNDAWFGDTTEPFLHHMVARMRAIETRRDLVRVVNTGVSAWTTATGFDEVATPTWVRRSFVAETRLLDGETIWTRFGDWPTSMLAGLLLGAALANRRATRSSSVLRRQV